ncbi:right-handed parallel beta-helix repeat-containing protein [Micromonospora matsumotoense]|uniref:right-handed parallel beta-helix repeat-containing protein n=1 Tax=Micromonospora matsumotoense TaxID=121616 RepID=UPI0033FF2189
MSCANDTGDDERINRAVAASAAGDEIVLRGSCLVDDTIRLAGERTYRGESRAGTVIRQADGANLDALLASDSYLDDVPFTGMPVTIRGLTIDGNRDRNPGAGDALVIRAWQSRIDDLVIMGSNRHGIRITNRSANGTALGNTQVNGVVSGNHIEGSGGHGIYVEDSGNSVTDWQLVDNWIADSGLGGITLENAAGWMVQRNHVYAVGGIALTAERLFGTSIADNYIEDFVGSGLRVSVQGEAASTIAGNRVFKSNGGTGTFVQIRVNYGTGNLVVSGNAIRGNGAGTGIDYQVGPGDGLVVAATGNLITAVGTSRRVGAGVSISAGL